MPKIPNQLQYKVDVDREELDNALKDAKKLASEIKKCEKMLEDLAKKAANIKITVSSRR